jgi:hypothetical protein
MMTSPCPACRHAAWHHLHYQNGAKRMVRHDELPACSSLPSSPWRNGPRTWARTLLLLES